MVVCTISNQCRPLIAAILSHRCASRGGWHCTNWPTDNGARRFRQVRCDIEGQLWRKLPDLRAVFQPKLDFRLLRRPGCEAISIATIKTHVRTTRVPAPIMSWSGTVVNLNHRPDRMNPFVPLRFRLSKRSMKAVLPRTFTI